MWSYVLGTIGITGLVVAARNPRIGWLISLTAQCVWVPYAIATEQWGFLPMSAGYTYAYVRLAAKAYRNDRDATAKSPAGVTAPAPASV